MTGNGHQRPPHERAAEALGNLQLYDDEVAVITIVKGSVFCVSSRPAINPFTVLKAACHQAWAGEGFLEIATALQQIKPSERPDASPSP